MPDPEGNWGWVTGIGHFYRDPFEIAGKQVEPSEIGFTVLHQGGTATAWERVFTNGRVLITDELRTTHKYEDTALITYLGVDNKVIAVYKADALGIHRVRRP